MIPSPEYDKGKVAIITGASQDEPRMLGDLEQRHPLSLDA